MGHIFQFFINSKPQPKFSLTPSIVSDDIIKSTHPIRLFIKIGSSCATKS